MIGIATPYRHARLLSKACATGISQRVAARGMKAAPSRPEFAMNHPLPTPLESIRAAGSTQIVLVFQGGGALGAYQGGVYQALDEAGIAPDWLIGTSIGAINAALIAGNVPDERLARLTEFWRRMRRTGPAGLADLVPGWGPQLSNALTMLGGVQGFFRPNPLAQLHLGPWAPFAPALAANEAGYYSTAPLAETLADLIDLDLLNACETRLTVGATDVRTGEMRYFDSRDMAVGIPHILASGALPPAFPPVAIDGGLYWDGGIVSNTPVEVVFDDNPRRSSLVFSVHVWRPSGPDPDSMVKVMARAKDIQYASRTMSHIVRQKELHRLRHVVAELVKKLPEGALEDPAARALAAFACSTTMHVVRLVAPPLAGEDHAKDIDFSADGIRLRWEAGYRDTSAVIAGRPWEETVDPLEGFVLHETEAGSMLGTR
jgi:NTE family protein